MSSFLAGASVNTSDLNQLSASIDLKLAGKMDAATDEDIAVDRLLVYNQSTPSTTQLTGHLELPGKLSINTAGTNTAWLSIGGGATSGNVPVAINTVSQYVLRGETENTYATTMQYNQHGCAYQCSMGSNSNEHPYVTFDALAANTNGQTRVANSWMRFRFNYQQRFEIWPSTTGVKAHAYGSLSDNRLKWNEEAITDGLAVIQQLKPTIYDKAADIAPEKPDDTTRESGFISQEVAAVLPHVAGPGPSPEDPWTVRYAALLPYHTAAIKELVQTISELEARVATLEN